MKSFFVVIYTLLAVWILHALYLRSTSTAHAQAAAWRMDFVNATYVEIHPDPLAGYVVECFDQSGNWYLPKSIQVAGPGLVMVNNSAPMSGYCVAK